MLVASNATIDIFHVIDGETACAAISRAFGQEFRTTVHRPPTTQIILSNVSLPHRRTLSQADRLPHHELQSMFVGLSSIAIPVPISPLDTDYAGRLE